MTKYAAFLRGINVSGQKSIKMAELRKSCMAEGLLEVETYIQSGNIVFSCEPLADGGPAKRISALILDAYGFEVAVIAKSAKELAGIVAANPLARPGACEPKGLYATLLERPPIPADMKVLAARASERYELVGDVIYTCYARGYGKSEFSNNFIERVLKLSATTRNWNTMLKVSEMAGSFRSPGTRFAS